MFDFNFEERMKNAKTKNEKENLIDEIEGIKIVNESLKFLGTKWYHLGRSENGIDCAGLLILSLNNLNYNTDFDIKKYGRYPDGKILLGKILEVCERVSYEEKQDGDVLLFKIDKNPQHLAFFIRDENEKSEFFIHSQNELQEKGTVITRLDEFWKSRLVGIFRFKKQ